MRIATRLRTPAVALALAALLGAVTGTTTTAAAAGGCAHPKLKVLTPLTTAPGERGSVEALGHGTIAAGDSGGLPVYWIDDQPLRVPFPAGYTYGTVNAVNKHGLMVGTVGSTATGIDAAFSYRIGDAKAKILPGGSYADDVNDHGDIAGGNVWVNPYTGYVWHGGAVKRRLTVPAGHELIAISGINDAGTVVGDGAYTPPGSPNEAIVGLVWPADPGQPALHLLPYDNSEGTGVTVLPQDIDDNGRIVGQKQDWNVNGAWPTYWDAPYTADGTQVPGLPGYPDLGYFHGASATSGLVAGQAGAFSLDDNPPATAEIWTGTGPVRALPPLAPGRSSTAVAAADNGRVGGYALDAHGITRPVIWTCAAQQAT